MNKWNERRSATPRKCAFLTMEDRTGFYIYDQLTFAPLAELGWEVMEIPWSRPNVHWGQFDAVVIRSPWDYQNHVARFTDVLSAIESTGTLLLNSLAICQWNMNKAYLRDLQQQGVPIVPTCWLDKLNAEVLAEAHQTHGTDQLVVKPLVGANADDTYRIARGANDVSSQRALQRFADRPCMVQPFIESVREVGEFSLFYFAGEYSHAILKTPARGDFRVQEEHGGVIMACQAPEDLLPYAGRVLQAIGERLLYARIDFVRLADGRAAVMEVELIEPSLYFSHDAQSPHRFAVALNAMFERHRSDSGIRR